MARPPTLTEMIHRMQCDGYPAAGPVFAIAAERLQRIAVTLLAREQTTVGLHASDLIQEVWIQKALRLNQAGPVNNREHFFSLMVRGMRQVLVDRHRLRKAKRRTIPDGGWTALRPDPRLAELAMLRNRLREVDPQAYKILWLKSDEGLTWDEVSRRTGIPVRTCRAEYDHAIYWLRKHMG